MKNLVRILFFGITLLSFLPSNAQELNCKVSISIDQIQVNEQRGATQIYNELQNVIQEFLNNRRWTNDNFLPEEKINCSLALIITKALANGEYEANARFQVIRPVYGTSYETVLLNYVDKSFKFKYLSGAPLYYNDNNFTDNLTQMLAFYAYIALAFDYDSFAKTGGNTYAQKAFNVVNIAQSAGGAWVSSSDIRSRYWLAENLINQQLQGVREGFYAYHRLGLDVLSNNATETKKQIMAYLNTLKQVNSNRPGQLIMRLFFEAKTQELISIFSDSSLEERKKVSALLISLDPTNSEAYRKFAK